MKVKNQKCIRRLSYKSLWATRKRNVIAIFAIALTTLLFTSLFTILMSLNESYETYNFRQAGGYADGTFKELSEEQVEKISVHPGIREAGERTVCGFCTTCVFGKVPAEVSYMDKNCTKWSYATPTTGREPEKSNEIAMDTVALKLLGVTPELGAKVTIEYQAGDKTNEGFQETDTFILSGYWEYDDLMPVHYINVSKDYVKSVQEKWVASGEKAFRTDLNVMLPSKLNIEQQMQKIDTDLGYDWNTRDQENSARIGVNWGLTASQLNAGMDPELLAAIAAFLLLVIFTGYLIIYNIFQISVTGDIRFYGLLKTIGTTPRQLKRMIRQQAFLLCVVGIPAGLLLGYGIGAWLTPIVLKGTTVVGTHVTISSSPVIFAGSAIFAVITVFLSCTKPGKMAAKVSPVEATKYTECVSVKKKRRSSHGAKVYQMAFANLGRNKKKTVLVVISLALSVTLLNVLCSFVGGFDTEKYISQRTCADFIVSSTDYFRYNDADEYISEETIAEIQENTSETVSGSGYMTDMSTMVWMDTEQYKKMAVPYLGEEELEEKVKYYEKRGSEIKTPTILEGLDEALFEKVTVLDGELDPLFDENTHAIAIRVHTDDYGNVENIERYPKVGDTLTMVYQNMYGIDTRTGEPADPATTPEEYVEIREEEPREVDYTVCALVEVPYAMTFRYSGLGYDTILPAERMREDCSAELIRKFYLFDTPDMEAENAAERYLAELTAGDTSVLMYESKASIRSEFEQFQKMFFLLGGVLCAIIGLVGILNFFNAIMTGILARKREFAVLQSVGMTNRQLKQMLVQEGLFYTAGSVVVAFLLSLVCGPLSGDMMEKMFWFCTYHFTILPVIAMLPVFAVLGCLIPAVLYQAGSRQSIVERLREAE